MYLEWRSVNTHRTHTLADPNREKERAFSAVPDRDRDLGEAKRRQSGPGEEIGLPGYNGALLNNARKFLINRSASGLGHFLLRATR